MSSSDDWTRASDWLASTSTEIDALAVRGVPLARNSVTPARYDRAPTAIRERLHRLSTYDSVHHVELLDLPVVDLGDSLDPPVLDRPLTIILGGHNGVTFEVLRHVEHLSGWGLLTVDAHHDVRQYVPDQVGNGSPVRALLDAGLPGANIVQLGINGFSNSRAHYEWCIEHGIEVHPLAGLDDAATHLAALADRCESVYVDLDIDVLDRSFAPGCPGSRPGGAVPSQLFSIAHLAGTCPAVKAMDIVEVDPESDVASITTDSAALALLYAASGYQLRRASR